MPGLAAHGHEISSQRGGGKLCDILHEACRICKDPGDRREAQRGSPWDIKSMADRADLAMKAAVN